MAKSKEEVYLEKHGSSNTPEIVESDFDYYFARYNDYHGFEESRYMGKPNLMLGALKDIGDHLFADLKRNHSGEYRSEAELRMAFKWYTDKCQQFEIMPTMGNYAVLIHASKKTINEWVSGRSRTGTYYTECFQEFKAYCETAMSNATLTEEVPIVAGIFHLKAEHGWSDQPEQKPIEVVHTVQALSDISQRYNISLNEEADEGGDE